MIWLNAANFRKKDFVIRLIVDIMDIHILNDAVFVNDKDGPF